MMSLRYWVRWILLALLLLVVNTTVVFAAPKIRVGWFPVPGLQNYDTTTGEYSGYNYDYLKAVSQFTGWEYEFVIEPLANCLDDLQQGKIDLIGNLAKNQEREKLFLYTNYDAGRAAPRLVTQITNTRYAFEDFASFNGMKIGVIKGSYLEQALPAFAAAHHFTYQLKLFQQPQALDSALIAEQIDAALISGLRTLNNTRILSQLPAETVYFICAKDKPWIRDQFDYALSMIRHFDKSFDDRVYAKYFANQSTPAVTFSISEKEFLQQLSQKQDTINVLYDPSWLPIEAKDPNTGAYIGMGKDIYELLSQRTGLKFKFYTADSFKDTLDKYGGKVDLYSLISYDYLWADHLNISLTQPFMETQVFKIYNNNPSENTIALPENYYITKAVQERTSREGRNPVYKLYRDTLQCLDAVRNREADSTYINSFELNYFMDKIQLEHLNIQSIDGFTINYSIGVSKKADPNMLALISRGVASITPYEINQIIITRTQHRLQPSLTDRIYANPLRYFCIAILILIFIGIIIFLYLSNRYNNQQRMILQATNKAKSEFLSRVSHDIRTPIHAIISMTNFAKEDINDKEKVQAELNKIGTSSNYLLSLLNDVLDISKAESSKMELHPVPYPFDEYINSLRNIFEPLCEKNGLNFIIKGEGKRPCNGVIVDRVRLDQVIMNLLSNAVKYTPAGGTITYISDSKLLPDGMLDCGFKVIDTGIGMSQKFQKVMFEPFSQESDNPARSSVAAGTGLGLAIVKKIVDLMQGRISVHSEPGQGTEIEVRFKLAPATDEQLRIRARQTGAVNLADAALQFKGKVLLAEDNTINTEIALRILHGFNLEVDTAKNGQEALQLFQQSVPGTYKVILMDIQMPIMNGYETAAKIRQLNHADAAAIPIFALTADVFADAVQKSRAAGMNEHIPKPINPQFLYEILSKYLK